MGPRGRSQEGREPTLSGEFPLEGELKCPPAPAHPGGGKERGRPERSPAAPEMVKRRVGGGEAEQGRRRGGGGGGKRKAGRNLRSPSPAAERETGWGAGLCRGVAAPGRPLRTMTPPRPKPTPSPRLPRRPLGARPSGSRGPPPRLLTARDPRGPGREERPGGAAPQGADRAAEAQGWCEEQKEEACQGRFPPGVRAPRLPSPLPTSRGGACSTRSSSGNGNSGRSSSGP